MIGNARELDVSRRFGKIAVLMVPTSRSKRRGKVAFGLALSNFELELVQLILPKQSPVGNREVRTRVMIAPAVIGSPGRGNEARVTNNL
jgi:hypothetical protein